MSHLPLLIIGDNPETQLEPFYEQVEEGSPYYQFIDETDDVRSRYDGDGTTKSYFAHDLDVDDAKVATTLLAQARADGVVLDTGWFSRIPNVGDAVRLRYDGDDAWRFAYAHVRKVHHPDPRGRPVTRVDLTAIDPPLDVAYRDKYPTFDVFAEEYCGLDRESETSSRWGRWGNPNAKWDGYVLGGRWKDSLTLTTGRRADTACKGAIDLDRMLAENRALARDRYDEFERATKGMIPRTGDPERDQPWVVEAIRCGIVDLMGDETIPTRDAYVANTWALWVHAVLDHGEWIENGRMGWWGITHGAGDLTQWNNAVLAKLRSLHDDTLLSIYDLHI